MENNSLDKIIIMDSLDEGYNKVIYKKGKKLDDDKFREIVNEITLCFDVDSKIEVIKAEILSLEDFIDVLKADCIFENEYRTIFPH